MLKWDFEVIIEDFQGNFYSLEERVEEIFLKRFMFSKYKPL